MPLIKGSSGCPKIVASVSELQQPQKGLEPIYAENTRLLILGTFPGNESLLQREYYSNPRNRFWSTLSSILPLRGSYIDKLKMLLKHRIGIWDIFSYVDREGSTDKEITAAVFNDFETFFEETIELEYLVFNGQKAQKCLLSYKPWIKQKFSIKVLPSTSPANATFDPDEWVRFFESVLF